MENQKKPADSFAAVSSVKEFKAAIGNGRSSVSFDGTVDRVIAVPKDEADKHPLKIVAKLESTGETISVSSWDADTVALLKGAEGNPNVFRFYGSASEYNSYPELSRAKAADLGIRSRRKLSSSAILDMDPIKKAVADVIASKVKDKTCLLILNDLILGNPDYFAWPAAKKNHHAYKGGLACHSLGVCMNALSIAGNYSDSEIDVSILVTGALIHDIGKLREYKSDGEYNQIDGQMLGHVVIGELMLQKEAIKLNLPDDDQILIQLEHIVASHHGERDKGAPVAPATLEAVIVSKADDIDATVDSCVKALGETLNVGESTSQIQMLMGTPNAGSGGRLIRIHALPEDDPKGGDEPF